MGESQLQRAIAPAASRLTVTRLVTAKIHIGDVSSFSHKGTRQAIETHLDCLVNRRSCLAEIGTDHLEKALNPPERTPARCEDRRPSSTSCKRAGDILYVGEGATQPGPEAPVSKKPTFRQLPAPTSSRSADPDAGPGSESDPRKSPHRDGVEYTQAPPPRRCALYEVKETCTLAISGRRSQSIYCITDNAIYLPSKIGAKPPSPTWVTVLAVRRRA